MSLGMADIVVAAIILAIGLVIGFDAVRLGYGWGMEGPKPGFFPFILAVIIIFGCLVIIWQAIRAKESPKSRKPLAPAAALKPLLTVLLPAVGMLLLTEVVGLYVSAILYLVGYIRWVGRFSWVTTLLIGILVPIAFYILFEKIFLIPMPMGLYGTKLRI